MHYILTKYYTNISLLYNYTCSYMFRPLKVIFRKFIECFATFGINYRDIKTTHD